MKKQLLAVVAATIALGGSAMAADLGVRAPVYKAPPPVPVTLAGRAATSAATSAAYGRARNGPMATVIAPVGTTRVHDTDSWLGGVQAGCDYQFAGGFVIGIQGDYAWTDADGQQRRCVDPDFTDHSRIRSLATVTGRIGYAWDRFLGYVKGGGAWEKDNYYVHRFPGRGCDGQRNSQRMDHWCRRRICLHQLPLGLRRIQLLRLRQPRYHVRQSYWLVPYRHQGHQERRESRSQLALRRLGRSGDCSVLITRKAAFRTKSPRASLGLFYLCTDVTRQVAQAEIRGACLHLALSDVAGFGKSGR